MSRTTPATPPNRYYWFTPRLKTAEHPERFWELWHNTPLGFKYCFSVPVYEPEKTRRTTRRALKTYFKRLRKESR